MGEQAAGVASLPGGRVAYGFVGGHAIFAARTNVRFEIERNNQP
jgi:hypothetical protein